MSPKLELILQVIAVVEIALVNLVYINSCLKKKGTFLKRILIIFTAFIIITFLCLVIHYFYPIFFNAIFVLMGFLFIFAFKVIYKNTVTSMITVLCSSYIYTLSVFSLSVQIAGFFDPSKLTLVVLIVENIVLLLTFYPVWKFMNVIYKVIVTNLTDKLQIYLNFTGISLFCTIFVFHISTVTETPIFNIINVIMLFISASITFFMLYQVVRFKKNAEIMKQAAMYDTLTVLKNRKKFNDDFAELGQKKDFYVFFLDLDSFKTINDIYGHNGGDDYLKRFSRITRNVVESHGGELYRFAGDEFTVLYEGSDPDILQNKILKHNNEKGAYRQDFLGVSIGYAKVECANLMPIEDVIAKADAMMYLMKRSKYNLRSE